MHSFALYFVVTHKISLYYIGFHCHEMMLNKPLAIYSKLLPGICGTEEDFVCATASAVAVATESSALFLTRFHFVKVNASKS